MEAVAIGLVLSMFPAIDDPRACNARHRLVDIFAIALLAMLSGFDDYPGIVEFGLDRIELLTGLLALPHGIPSVSTFRRVIAAVAELAEAVEHAPPGIFDARSWAYWNLKIGRYPAPAMPVRSFDNQEVLSEAVKRR
jgi:hypothetical protein